MKLIQLNLWQGRLLSNALEFMQQEQPDILCLQEVTSSEVENPGFLDTNSLQTLLKELDLPNYFFSPRFSYQFMHSRALYGNCILSRYPISNQETRFTHGDFVEDIVLNKDNHDMSNAQLAVLDLGKHSLNIINHHGYYQPNPVGNQTTTESLQKLADWVAELSGPAILAGDLNVWPKSPALNSINSLGLNNLTSDYAIRSTLSEIHQAPNKNEVACDYVFTSKDIKVTDFHVMEKLVSDHKALVLEFEL